MTKNNDNSLQGVQYLRAILVFLVVVDHAGILISLGKYYGIEVIPSYINFFGVVGVNIFFMVSGFIIVYTSTAKHSMDLTVVSVGDFLKKRALRLLPIMWISIVAYALLKRIGRGEWGDVDEYVTAVFLYPFADINPTQLWTLRHEVYFYIIFAFSLLFARSWIVPVFLWFVSPFLLFEKNDMIFEFFFSPFNLLFGFGVVLCLFRKKINFQFKENSNTWFGVMFVGSLLIAFLCGIIDYSHKSLYTVFVFGVFGSIIVLVSVLMPMKISGVFGKILGVCGDASYSIYLFHGIFLSAIIGYLSKFKDQFNVYLTFMIVVILTMALGVLVYFFVEKKIVGFLKSKFYS